MTQYIPTRPRCRPHRPKAELMVALVAIAVAALIINQYLAVQQ